MKELIIIQSGLKAPKNQRNSFGNYNYRSAEDIVEAVKPLLFEESCILTITDDLVLIGERYYVKATATLTNENKESVSTTAYAREEETKKGMDGAQITGAASSYARKYALNGLFCIDDTKDPDATNKHDDEERKYNAELNAVLEKIRSVTELPQLVVIWNENAKFQKDVKFISAMTNKRKGLDNASK